MNKICTSLEQSKKLLGLGIDVNTADMHYSTWTILNEGEYILSPNQGETIEELQESYGNQVIPAWSLSALLGLMPDVINLNGTNYRQQEFKTENSYCYCYADETFPISFYGQPVDAAFEMVCWLKENENIWHEKKK